MKSEDSFASLLATSLWRFVIRTCFQRFFRFVTVLPPVYDRGPVRARCTLALSKLPRPRPSGARPLKRKICDRSRWRKASRRVLYRSPRHRFDFSLRRRSLRHAFLDVWFGGLGLHGAWCIGWGDGGTSGVNGLEDGSGRRTVWERTSCNANAARVLLPHNLILCDVS